MFAPPRTVFSSVRRNSCTLTLPSHQIAARGFAAARCEQFNTTHGDSYSWSAGVLAGNGILITDSRTMHTNAQYNC